jgi:hypothetical protein
LKNFRNLRKGENLKVRAAADLITVALPEGARMEGQMADRAEAQVAAPEAVLPRVAVVAA